eukprot:368995-Pelagomonas_calceolata.AAC.1
MKVGVIVSNPQEEVVSMFEMCVKTKACSSLSSGMLKGWGPGCELCVCDPGGSSGLCQIYFLSIFEHVSGSHHPPAKFKSLTKSQRSHHPQVQFLYKESKEPSSPSQVQILYKEFTSSPSQVQFLYKALYGAKLAGFLFSFLTLLARLCWKPSTFLLQLSCSCRQVQLCNPIPIQDVKYWWVVRFIWVEKERKEKLRRQRKLSLLSG